MHKCVVKRAASVVLALAALCAVWGAQEGPAQKGSVSAAEVLPQSLQDAGTSAAVEDLSEMEAEEDTSGRDAGEENSSAGTDAAEEPSAAAVEEEIEQIEQVLASMTIDEKVAQLFVVAPEALTGGGAVTTVDSDLAAALEMFPVGGIVFFKDNLVSAEQTRAMLTDLQAVSEERIGLPLLLCVDEEGGTVARIAGNDGFDVPDVGNMADIGASGDTEQAREAGVTIGTYLAGLGFNVDFAPVADVWTNPENTVVQKRAFGSDAQLVSDMAATLLAGLQEQGVYGTYKHFPGHGNTAGDTHDGYAYSEKTLEELMSCEFVPFQAGIAQDVSFIMAAHIALPNVTGDDTPASMSSVVLTDVLRGMLGYDGVIITDALNMGAVTANYSSAEAAVTALQAGADLLLMPENFAEAYTGVLEAIVSGDLTEERIDESLARILKVKMRLEG